MSASHIIRKFQFTFRQIIAIRMSRAFAATAIMFSALSLAVPAQAQGPSSSAAETMTGAQAGNIRNINNNQQSVRLIVSYANHPSQESLNRVTALGAHIEWVYNIIPAIDITIPETQAAQLLNDPAVTLVEPDIECYAFDDELDNTWGVKHIGGGFAHNLGQFGTHVKVAVLDTGVDYTHPELAAVYQGGYDFVNNDNDPMDDHFHGTHVSGTIAAAMDGVGVVGVAPQVDLYACKVLNAQGTGNFGTIIAALDWCVQHDIQVTNQSLGSPTNPGQAVEDAYDAAYSAGILNVAAAGNFYGLFGVEWPARYDSVVAVGAIDMNNQKAAFSDYGPQLDLCAPGVHVLSTIPGGGYEYLDGTSMASPHVAGAAALVFATGIADANHNGRVNDEVKQRLEDTAVDLGAEGFDNKYGFGMVNAQAALSAPLGLTSSNLVRGQVAGIDVAGAAANTSVALLYSGRGTSPTGVNQLNVLLALKAPVLADVVQSDGSGNAHFDVNVPPNAPTVSIWMQAACNGKTSLVVKKTVE